MSRTMGRLAAIAVFLIAQAGLASAAEIKVFSTIGVKGALEELTPQFEKAHRPQAQYHLEHCRAAGQTRASGRASRRADPDQKRCRRRCQGQQDRARHQRRLSGSRSLRSASRQARRNRTFPPPTRSRRRCWPPKASVIPIRPPAAPAVFISPSRSRAWASPTR